MGSVSAWGRLQECTPATHLGLQQGVWGKGFSRLLVLGLIMNSLKRKGVTLPWFHPEIRREERKQCRSSARPDPVFICNFGILFIMGLQSFKNILH